MLYMKFKPDTKLRRCRNGESPRQPVTVKIDPTVDMKTPPKIQVDAMSPESISPMPPSFSR